MSRREILIKATVGAMQPANFDLTKLRKRIAGTDEPIPARPHDLLAALAFSAMPSSSIEGDRIPGQGLRALALRIKYAGHGGPDLYRNAAKLLITRATAKNERRASLKAQALAMVAIYEWAHSACPACRTHPARAENPTAGLKCMRCWATGEVALTPSKRRMLLNTAIPAPRTEHALFTPNEFKEKWAKKYHKLLSILRGIDRDIVRGVDIQLRSLHNRDTESGQEQEFMLDDEPDAISGSAG
jgi:hypothetical protein